VGLGPVASPLVPPSGLRQEGPRVRGDASGRQGGAEGVAQVVEADRADPGAVRRPLEAAYEL
jgi:hypothetical protein